MVLTCLNLLSFGSQRRQPVASICRCSFQCLGWPRAYPSSESGYLILSVVPLAGCAGFQDSPRQCEAFEIRPDFCVEGECAVGFELSSGMDVLVPSLL
ncbi:hypothetical protein Bca4012_061106 [Brassica carinata]|uniref:Uncharacterized protein n=1 Tax=Brassica carinata TaxID=52824 RepID=A0A8X7V5D0_BRACI|nr:hypothetical protein Bca52824_031428 [Brassica carinata]